MLEKGSLVKLVNMEYEYGTGFDKSWQNGMVGTVSKYTKVTNVNDNSVTVKCNIDLLVPYITTSGEPINWLVSVDARNLEEIVRVPIILNENK